MKRLAVTAALFLCSSVAHAQPLADALIPFATPIPEIAPRTGACELDAFLSAARSARIIALGEPTHGTAEVFRLKHCALQRLVTDGDVRHIVFEMSVGEGADLNDYISGRRNDLEAILRGLPLWMFQTEEFADLIRSLRQRNSSTDAPVRLYGMEAQYADRSARHALAYLRAHDPSTADRLRQAFGAERVASDTASASSFAFLYAPISDSTLAAYQSLALGLRSVFDSRRAEFVAATNEDAFAEARRHVTALGQFTSLALLEDPREKAQLRDYVMAVNVSDIVGRARASERVVLWGHNEHVWKREGNGGYDVLGRQLARWYGSNYYAVGFDFGSGAYRAPANDGWVHEVGAPEPASFTASMARRGQPNLFLDLRGAGATAAGRSALAGEFTVRASAGGYVPMRNGQRFYDQTITLADRYDGLFFLSTSTPSTVIAR